jgi:sugar-specific transcriptional regulator TrmB
MDMVQDLLKKIGFNDKEIEVYLAVLKQGKVIPADVSQATGINRTTVYSIAKELIKKGIISEDLGSKTRYLVALPPEDLESLVKKEEKKLKEKKETIQETISQLQSFAKETKYSIPKITFISEEDIEQYLYKQASIWNKSIIDIDKTATWWGFQDSYFVPNYEKWIDWSWEDPSSKGVSLKLLSNKSGEKEKGKQIKQRQIKFWKKVDDFTGTIWVCGNYIIMLVLNNHPYYLVEIHDSVLAHNMREMFKGIWKDVK